MRTPVKRIDIGFAPIPVNAWMAEADRLIWSDIAQCMRVAGDLISTCVEISSAQSLASRRAWLAQAEGEIAKARMLTQFLCSLDTRKNARKAINKLAACVRAERGV